MMIRFSLLCTVLFALSVGAAQEAPTSIPFQVYLWPGTPNPNLDTQIRSHRNSNEQTRYMVDYVPPTIQFSPDGKSQAIDIKAAERRLSPTYRYFGENPLVFFREVALREGQMQRVELGRVNIPDGLERALLLFMPNPKDSNTFLIYPIDNSVANTRPGEARIYNITGSPIAVLFGESKLLLKPGQQQLVQLDTTNRVAIMTRIGDMDDDGEWKERYAQQLSVQPEDSLTLLIYNKPDKKTAYRIMRIDNPKSEPAISEPSTESDEARGS